MTTIKDFPHFIKAVNKAKQYEKGLENLLEQIFKHSEEVTRNVVIYSDRAFGAEYNFGFTIFNLKRTMIGDATVDKWEQGVFGGIIFDESTHKWQTHT